MISIIVPAYNSEPYIKECIDSVILQEFHDCELIIVDDYSTDNTLSICQAYEKQHDIIKVFSNSSNLGEGLTRNVGINNAKGDYLLFLDSDDKLLPNSLSYISKMIVKYKFDILTYPLTSKINTIFNIERKKYINKLYSGTDAFCMFLCYRRMSGYAGGKVVRRDIVGDDRFEKLRIGSDGDMMIRLFAKCQNVLYTNRPIYFYRVYDSSASERMVFTEKMLDGVRRLPYIKQNLFRNPVLRQYEKYFDVFEFRTLYARLEKMDKTNSVDSFKNDFKMIVCRIKQIRIYILILALRWNMKTIFILIKFWLLCAKYHSILIEDVL